MAKSSSGIGLKTSLLNQVVALNPAIAKTFQDGAPLLAFMTPRLLNETPIAFVRAVIARDDSTWVVVENLNGDFYEAPLTYFRKVR